MNSRIQAGWSGQARAETICPSTTAALSTNPARRGGYVGRQRRIGGGAAAGQGAGRGQDQGAWHSWATGLSPAMKWRTIRCTSGSFRMYSGARPPGMTRAT